MMTFVDWNRLHDDRLQRAVDYINVIDNHVPMVENEDDAADYDLNVAKSTTKFIGKLIA